MRADGPPFGICRQWAGETLNLLRVEPNINEIGLDFETGKFNNLIVDQPAGAVPVGPRYKTRSSR